MRLEKDKIFARHFHLRRFGLDAVYSNDRLPVHLAKNDCRSIISEILVHVTGVGQSLQAKEVKVFAPHMGHASCYLHSLPSGH